MAWSIFHSSLISIAWTYAFKDIEQLQALLHKMALFKGRTEQSRKGCHPSAIGFKTPIEMCNGKPADYSNLKVFGSLAFAHTKQDKLDPRAIKCVFIGYPKEIKGYKLWRIDQGVPKNEEHCRNAERSPFNSASDNNDESFQIEVESSKDQKINHEDITDTSLDDNVATKPDLANYNLVMDRERRVIKPSIRYGETNLICYALSVTEDLQRYEPSNYREAINSEDKEAWMTSMNEEMQSLEKNQTWILVDIPKSQRLDVKTAFLHGDREETIYMQQPEGFAKGGTKVCLLKKSLYGLKQSPRQWYRKFDDFMIRTGFQICSFDSSVYILKEESQERSPSQEHSPVLQESQECFPTYLLLYVDDILLARSSKDQIKMLKVDLSNEFEMKELEETKRILGMDIKRNKMKGKLFLSQAGYLKKVVTKYRMHEARHVTTPLGQNFKLSMQDSPKTDEERQRMSTIPYSSGVGSIMYGMICSRPDLAYVVNVVSRFMTDPRALH
uniref:Uncharacterized protein LOC105851982 n=1 Tax=Cicer arietinum TaxID=3827 RepID=A0A1S3E567_CICAR|nr:uncharacterized protein LOC105851982 [Cicer arietinum]